LERRLREAARLGFRTAVVPKSRRGGAPQVKGITIVVAADLREAIGHALAVGREPSPPQEVESAAREE
jgi:predicted ATP-dependent serine protease